MTLILYGYYIRFKALQTELSPDMTSNDVGTFLTMWWRRVFLVSVSLTVVSLPMYSMLKPPAPLLLREEHLEHVL